MKGCRPLTKNEADHLTNAFAGCNATRDRAMFLLGLKSGFRISELLSLRRSDLVEAGRIVERVSVERKHMKKQIEGRTILLHPVAAEALRKWLQELSARGYQTPEAYVFQSLARGNRPISRVQAWRILRSAYGRLRMTGKLGCHSMRKTFADRIYDHLEHDLMKTRVALGHVNVNSTVSYLSFREADIDDAILAM